MVVSNNFFLLLPLFKVSYDVFKVRDNHKVRIDLNDLINTINYLTNHNTNNPLDKITLYDIESEIHIYLYHNFDTSELIIKFDPKAYDFKDILNFLSILNTHSLAITSTSKWIAPIDETNSYIYGKLAIELGYVKIAGFEGNVFVSVSLGPYTFHSKTVIKGNTNFGIKQIFLAPVHNRFDVLKIEVFTKTHQGIFHKKIVDEKAAEYQIYLPDIMNNYFFPNRTMEIAMENINKNIKATHAFLTLKIKNYSNILAVILKNKNKNILEDVTLVKAEDEISIKILLKRIKKIGIFMKDLKEGFKKLFRFQYPIFSSLVWACIVIYFLFCKTANFITHLCFLFAFLIFINSSTYKSYLSSVVNDWIFSKQNPYCFESYISTKIDEERNEVMEQHYLTQEKKKEVNIIKSYILEPIKRLKNLKSDYNRALFKLSKFVAAIEKAKNLFKWTDPLLSFLFMALLMVGLILTWNIPFNIIMLISFSKKFITGINYYKKQYINNLEIARLVINYCNKENPEYKQRRGSLTEIPQIPDEAHVDSPLNDDKFKVYLKEQLEYHADIVIGSEFLSYATSTKEVKEAIGKTRSMLKIKKGTPIYSDSLKNSNLYKVPFDIENVLYYFILNIKSDYFISKYYHDLDGCADRQSTSGPSQILKLDSFKSETQSMK